MNHTVDHMLLSGPGQGAVHDAACQLLQKDALLWRAGALVMLSTAYRVWVVWRYNLPLPYAAFGSDLRQEMLDFKQYQVGCMTSMPCDRWRPWLPLDDYHHA
jgi:hypothetical protein